MRLSVLTKVGFDLRNGIGIGNPELDLEDTPFNFVPENASFTFAEKAVESAKVRGSRTLIMGVPEFEQHINILNAWLELRDHSLENLEYFEKLILLYTLLGKSLVQISYKILRPLDEVIGATEGVVFQGIVNTYRASSSI